MKHSAGIIPYRFNKDGEMEFFVGHPGGNKENIWYYLKGQTEDGEDLLAAAIREFREETGLELPGMKAENLILLGTVKQSKYKTVTAFGIHFPDIDPDICRSNLIEDGVTPEIDRYMWMTYEKLYDITHPLHREFYEKLIDQFGYIGQDAGESID